MASTSTSSIPKSFKYDVFLSFRGEDTRHNFVSHLYKALEQQGILTYKDDEKIKKGETIDTQLMESIEESRFFIIVFSKDYAGSSWCLDELVKIMECRKASEQTAYPVFYDVEPTEIRKQSGAVEKAFKKHENKKAAGKWRKALNEVGNLAGWELKKTANWDESKLIQIIVDDIFQKICSSGSSVDGNLVGMETRIETFLSSLELDAPGVRMIGIWGMGGGGKTILTTTMFYQICQRFEGSSFVDNVREVSKSSLSGLKELQKQILTDIFWDQDITVSSVSGGKNKMLQMMRRKKVLVVLDDVDSTDQLEALAGDPNWYKSGSRIIITTRDEQVLVAHRVGFINNVTLLSHTEAIRLFNRYAFSRETPIQGHKELSGQVIEYAHGLPLTIKVLGSLLCGQNEPIWKDVLERLKIIPLKETMKILELSFDALDDDYKEIFLDVACLLKGWEKDDAVMALKSCGFFAEAGLKVLEQRSLMNTRHPSSNKMYKTGCRGIENWNLPNALRFLKWMGYPFKSLPKTFQANYLVGLQMNHSRMDQLWKDGEEKPFPFLKFYKSYELRTLDLSVAPNLETLRLIDCDDMVELRMSPKCPNLVNIDLTRLELTTLHLITQKLETLRLNNFTNMVELHMPAECPKLVYLDLNYNANLTTLHLGISPNLKTVSLKDCRALVKLQIPAEYPKLVTLNLSFCMRFAELPEEIGRLECLKELDITGTGISRLPESIFRVKGLRIGWSRWLLESCGFTEIKISNYKTFGYVYSRK